jgi:hypothetical protein
MPLLNTYQRQVQRAKKKISQLKTKKVREQEKLTRFSQKINRANDAISRTSSSSTIRSKLKQIDRDQKKAIKVEKKIADFDKKIAKKEKNLLKKKEKVNRQQKRERDKKIKEEKKRIKNLNSKIGGFEKNQLSIKSDIEKLKELPDEIVILFFAANPSDQTRLQLDEEVREIQEMIRKAKFRDSLNFHSCWAVRPTDILQAINEYEPSIIHFSGHGSTDDEIIFLDKKGNAKPVSKEAIVQTVMASAENIRLIFFNTCYSENQANAVTEHIEAAIGMNTNIGDHAARVFSSRFYSSIGFGHSLEKAFEQGKAALMLEDIKQEDIPELFTHSDLDPAEIVIVNPTS